KRTDRCEDGDDATRNYRAEPSRHHPDIRCARPPRLSISQLHVVKEGSGPIRSYGHEQRPNDMILTVDSAASQETEWSVTRGARNPRQRTNGKAESVSIPAAVLQHR